MVEHLAIRVADLPVLDVHEQVGAGLQVRHPVDLAVDVKGAGSASCEDLHRDAVLLDEGPGLDGPRERLLGPPLALAMPLDVHHVSGVRLEPVESQ